MGKKRSLSEAQQAQIVILRQEGYTERAISERRAVSKTTVVKFNNSGQVHGLSQDEKYQIVGMAGK